MRLRELTALYRAIAAVNAIAEPDAAADSVLVAALDLVGADTGSIMLVDEEGENLVIAAAEGLSRAVVLSTRQRIGEGIAGWVAREAAPLLLNGTARGDERFHNVADREMAGPPVDVRAAPALRPRDRSDQLRRDPEAARRRASASTTSGSPRSSPSMPRSPSSTPAPWSSPRSRWRSS